MRHRFKGAIFFATVICSVCYLSCAADLQNGEAISKDSFGHQKIFIMSLSTSSGVNLGFSADAWSHLKEFWEPNAEQIKIAEKTTAEYVGEYNEKYTTAYPVNLDNYHRQYMGIVVNGKRYIYGNFYTPIGIDASREKKEFILVFDGGMNFFRIVVDPATGLIADFESNGEA